MIRTLVAMLALVSAGALSAAESNDRAVPANLSAAERESRIANDAQAAARYRDGLLAVVEAARTRTDLFPAETPERHVLDTQARRDLLEIWQAHLDYLYALDSLGQAYRDFWKLKGAGREEAFLITYAAFLAQMRGAQEFITLIEKDPTLEVALNEAVPDSGLEARQYAAMKWRFLNLARETEFGLLWTAAQANRGSRLPELRAKINEDLDALQSTGFKRRLLAGHMDMQILRDGASTAWFPLQSGVAEWMGDTRVSRQESLISQKQIAGMIGVLQPGDILLERREWYLSNIGLPGYWPHAAIYIGTPQERAAYFADPSVREWVCAQGRADGDFEALLRSRTPKSYQGACADDPLGHPPRVIEAMSEGVVFTSIEHSASADALAVLRPHLTRKEKAMALLRAFGYAGRPYDFDFDFQTDTALVCTELVYKSFEPSADARGLKLPLVQVLGRPATPANEIARQYDQEYATRQYDMVLFLDGYEKESRAIASTEQAFRESWKRPKWHVLVQDAPEQAN